MLYKFQPFSVTKELGKEYNAHCAIVPNDHDWILILDYDAMVLDPITYQVIENAIKRYPETDIFGAITNRVGLSYQRRLPMLDTNTNLEYHKAEALKLGRKHLDGFSIQCSYVAGFFLLFKKSYWNKYRFQETIIDKKGNFFDWNFCRPAYRDNKNCKVIQGAYIWHTYRLGKDPKDNSHLQ
jgi:hypothetical protein